jgi:putative hydrolase of the HAD superfamily
MAATPALVLFDLDGVLAHYDRGLRCAALARATGVDPRRVHEVLFGADGLEHASDRGELDLEAYVARLRGREGWRVDAAAFVAARGAATRADAGMLALCDRLAPQARLAVFTNNGGWFADRLPAIAPALAGRFGGRVVTSGALRRTKPDPRAFADCLARLGGEPGSTLFIDDNVDNVAGARVAGLDALHFHDPAVLRADLRARGFATGDDDAP